MSDSNPVLPPKLRAKDTVAVCAPAGPVPAERLQEGVAELERRYRVVIGAGILERDGYLAGSDERRADELNRFLRDPDVRAVILARGGYGILRIAGALDADALRRDPKLLVAFSDGTALLFWALTQAGVRGIHGPMVGQFPALVPEDVRWLERLMEEPRAPGQIPAALTPLGIRGAGAFEGPLLGGNLALLSHMAGTPLLADLAGAILFLEDVGERPYRLDRYLTHLHLAGALRDVGAVLLGDLTGCEEEPGKPSPAPEEVVDERLRAFGLPGLRGIPAGHGARNLALPFGARCEVDFESGTAALLEGAVS